MARPTLLSTRQQRFVDAYCGPGPTAGNGSASARKAGYADTGGIHVQAERLLRNATIKAAIAKTAARRTERADVDAVRVLKELARVGLSDARQLYDAAGVIKPIHTLSDDTAAAVASVEHVMGRKGVRSTKVKLWDKVSALEKIARHLGLFLDRVEHSGEVRTVTTVIHEHHDS
jgi:phage terminase small subunit